MAKIAVLLAAYNGESFIVSQVNSILFQLGVDVDIYIRDDGSTDSTVSTIERFSELSNVFILKDSESTRSAAGNFFRILSQVELGFYDYIAFSDQDDIWDPEKMSRAVSKMSEGGFEGYSSDLVAYSNSKGQASYLKKSYPSKEFDYLFQGASAGCTYVMTSKLATTVAQSIAHLHSSDFIGRSHDWLVYAIARAHNMQWCYDYYAPIFYRQHSSNVYGAMTTLQGLLAKVKLVRDGWYRSNVLWIAEYCGAGEKEAKILALVKNYSFFDRLKLMAHSGSFRRKKSECRVLGVFFLLGLF
ncbi:Alpha-L-Rha alpha-1,3-L-rhamnosyltransferase [Pseudomonas sessilinigenes]|uniref:Glycosyltransferase n=2 Tax=Pseudomonas sessilinigenes TaxID=658629 RepID=A0ABX8MHZ7_9PSED|nr:glycosyltransferase [Pseudomonas sessilinigenes]AZC27866.1 Alpha-L-Rha alpha-1,3-L-rhamnosyltransferase [Pseudomonas sessilinigenes]QXH38258.1 glycosyltransferase [Pseudomonas sessilinigenes]